MSRKQRGSRGRKVSGPVGWGHLELQEGFPAGHLEPLEARQLLSGTWADLNPSNPGSGPGSGQSQALMLLSDGTVMVQDGGNTANTSWYRLAPTSSGDYTTGSWSALASMSVGRLFAATATLMDGRVFIVGGEYSTPFDFTNSAEIYNPVTNAWSTVASVPTPATQVGSNPPPAPTSQFGDDPIEVLPDGRVLAGYFNNGTTYLYDPVADSWTPTTGGKVRGDGSDEESWVKLSDNSILSYDIFGSESAGVFKAQRYVPSTDTWVDASTLDGTNPPSLLSSSGVGQELGPAFLLPDGTAIFFGANGNTAIYDPSADTWTAGPAEPAPGGTQLVMADAPGAMLPNGKVLLALSPIGTLSGGKYTFPTPSYIYEYDPVAKTYADVTPGGGIGQPSYQLNMVVLPTGQILLGNEKAGIKIYTPDGAPADAWRPVIDSIGDNGDGTYNVKGTQLTGISEGANYGDDMLSASNYPILRFTDGGGGVYYGRTYGWDSTGVAQGATPQTSQFTLPAGKTLADFTTVTLVANGIPSITGNLLVMDSGMENVTLRVDPFDSTLVQALVDGVPVATFANHSVNPIVVVGDQADNVLTVDQSVGVIDTPIDFDGGGQTDAPGDRLIVAGTSGDDTLAVHTTAETATEMSFDGGPTISFRNIRQLHFDAMAGNDTLSVDSTLGLLTLAGGVEYVGGDGRDALVLQQEGGDTQTSDTYNAGLIPGSGSSVITGPSGSQTIVFQGIEPVLDTVPATAATVNATPAANAVNYTAGSVPANGLVTIDEQESYEFSNKTNLVINGQAGSDEINLNNSSTPAGLTGTITVNGGDPSASDVLVVTGVTGGLDNLRYQPTAAGAGTVINDSAPQPNVLFTGMERLVLSIQQAEGDGVRLDGTVGNDNIEFTPGSIPGTGTFTGTMDTNNAGGNGPFSMAPMSFTGGSSLANDEDINFFNPGGTDTFAFNATDANDTIAVGIGEAGGTEFRDTVNGVVLARAEVFNVAGAIARGRHGDDLFTHDVAVTIPVTYEGGDPSDSDSVVFTGTAGDDTVEVSRLANGAQQVAWTGHPTDILTSIEQLTLNTGAGADTVTIDDLGRTSLGVIAIDVGADAALDAVTLNGSGAADTIALAMTANDSGIPDSVIDVQGLSARVRIAGTTVTGAADTVTVNGNNGADTILAATGDSLADPADVANHANLILNGGSGNDTLGGDAALNGGDGNDVLLSGPAGQSIDGGAGVDRVVSAAIWDTTQPFAFAASLTSLLRTSAGNALNDADTLAGVEEAQLAGGTGDDLFDVGAFYGRVLLTGGLGSDTLDYSAYQPVSVLPNNTNPGVTVDLDLTGVEQFVDQRATLLLTDPIENFAGSQFKDSIFVDASPVARFIDGNDPVFGDGYNVPPGDLLTVDGRGQFVNVSHIVGGQPSPDAGTVTAFGYQPVTFQEIEKLAVTNALNPTGLTGFNAQAFTASVSYLTGSRKPRSLATGDFNEDGRVDLAVVNSAVPGVASVMIGRGNGTFDPAAIFSMGTYVRRLYDVAVTDLDGDGHLDIVTSGVNRRGQNVVLLMQGNGDGTFKTPVTTVTTLKGNMLGLALADVDGDTDTDVVITGTRQVMVLSNDGAGNLTAQQTVLSSGRGLRGVTVEDFNHDGAVDIAVANFHRSTVSVFLNDGTGNFTLTGDFSTKIGKNGITPTSMTLGDFNNDGNWDLAVSDINRNALSILLGDGLGSFALQPQARLVKPFVTIAAGDFNGDGKTDLVLGSYNNFVAVLISVGNGTFSDPYVFKVGDVGRPEPAGLIVADFNNDGGADLAVADAAGNAVSILLKNLVI